MHLIKLFILFALSNAPQAKSYQAKIGDITSVIESDEYYVYGYGLVVGLQNTGFNTNNYSRISDYINQHIYTQQDMLQSVFNVPGALLDSSICIISANVKSTSQVGEKIDVYVNAVEMTKSIIGGRLVMGMLSSKNNQGTLISASGPIIKDTDLYTTGFVKNGGIVRKIDNVNIIQNSVSLKVNKANIVNAQAIASVIQDAYPEIQAKVVNSGNINLSLRSDNNALSDDSIYAKLTEIQQLNINIGLKSEILVNDINRTIMLQGDVSLPRMSIVYKNNRINVGRGQSIANMSDLLHATKEMGFSFEDLRNIIISMKEMDFTNIEIVILRHENTF